MCDSRVLLGVLGGFFIVPQNALIQFNTEDDGLGRILAGNNFVQNLVKLAFLGLTVAAAMLERGSVFIIGPCIPDCNGIVDAITPADGEYVMGTQQFVFDFFDTIPISSGHSKHALQQVSELLNQGEVVCLFPEGAISRNGQLGAFKKGFELAAQETEAGVILPFYLRGLWGTSFSFASAKLKENRNGGRTHDVVVGFGEPLPMSSSAEQVKQAVFELSVSSWQTHARSFGTLPEAWLETARRRVASRHFCKTTS